MENKYILNERIQTISKRFEEFFERPKGTGIVKKDFMLTYQDLATPDLITDQTKRLINAYNELLVTTQWYYDDYFVQICSTFLRDEKIRELALYIDLRTAQDNFTKIHL